MTQPNSTEKELEQNFNLWIEGHDLTEAQLTQLQMHPVWSERMLSMSSLNLLAEQAEAEPMHVPNWNKDQGFNEYLRQPSWWQSQGLSFAALTFSIFACFIMVFDIRVDVSDQGLRIASAEQIQNLQMEQQFAKLKQEMTTHNDQQIQNRLDNFQMNQQQSTAQLVNYILGNSRTERKEDIQQVVELLQQQRKDDMLFLRDQFSDMNYNLQKAQFTNRDRNMMNRNESQITE